MKSKISRLSVNIEAGLGLAMPLFIFLTKSFVMINACLYPVPEPACMLPDITQNTSDHQNLFVCYQTSHKTLLTLYRWSVRWVTRTVSRYHNLQDFTLSNFLVPIYWSLLCFSNRHNSDVFQTHFRHPKISPWHFPDTPQIRCRQTQDSLHISSKHPLGIHQTLNI